MPTKTEVRENTILGTVKRPPTREKTDRVRDYLTEIEVDSLRSAAKKRGRHGERDATMILVAYRHGLRVGELIGLRWEQIDFVSMTLHVNRLKGGDASRHFIGRKEAQELRVLKQRQNDRCSWVFVSERGTPFSTQGFSRILRDVAQSINFPLTVYPHMLRHSCGFKLANDGQDTRAIQGYLGHKNIQHTVRYTKLSAERFRGFWRD